MNKFDADSFVFFNRPVSESLLARLASGEAKGESVDTVASIVSAAQVSGNAGNNTLVGTNGADTIDGGGGNDFIFGGPVRTVNPAARSGNDRLIGGSGNDEIWGGDGNDVLIGGSGRDRLRGGDGFDRLIGSNDYMAGGPGADVYEFSGAFNIINGFNVVALPRGGGDHAKVRDLDEAEFTNVKATKVSGGFRIDEARLIDGKHEALIRFNNGDDGGPSDLIVKSLADFEPADLWPALL